MISSSQQLAAGVGRRVANQPQSDTIGLDQGEQMTRHKASLPPVPERCGPPTISLPLLIDFAIQHTLHEITVLSELLPKKKENDRKTSVIAFAYSTRMIFVKLQAIVKWIKSSKKFESLAAIRHFLDQQSLHFVDTADGLVNVARKELLAARVPTFQVAQAVDVLTLGSYPRLPQDIKDAFVSQRELSAHEQACTLHRLNKVIEYHLALASRTLSPRISSIVIRNGMAVLTVRGEFEITLTILGEQEQTRWCLLNINILVQNYTVGDGQELVHYKQLHFIHQIVQEKLDNATEPLHDAYCVLHSFCAGLQLAVLYTEAIELRNRVSSSYVKVEEYNRAKCSLTLSYWPPREARGRPSSSSTYRITISTDVEGDPHGGLRTTHHPTSSAGMLPLIDPLIGERLSLSQLLVETIVHRCRDRLLSTRRALESLHPASKVEEVGNNSTMMLAYELIPADGEHRGECLLIGMNSFQGWIVCKVPAIERCQEVRELESKLNNEEPLVEKTAIEKLLSRIRVLVLNEQFKVSGLSVRLVSESQSLPLLAKMKELPPQRICLQFTREEQFYLVVSLTHQDDGQRLRMELYLFSAQQSSSGDAAMMKLSLSEAVKSAPSLCGATPGSCSTLQTKKTLGQRLRSAIAGVDDRLLFLRISEELDRRGIKYEQWDSEPFVGGHVLRITNVSSVIPNAPSNEFFDNLVGCHLRLDIRQHINFPFECTMANFPVSDASFPAGASCTLVQPIITHSAAQNLTTSEAVTQNVVERLSILCHVYEPVRRLAAVLNDEPFRDSCTVEAFTYHKLVLSYGEARSHLMLLSWKPRNGRSRAQFTINFGMKSPSERTLDDRHSSNSMQWNPHILVAPHLTERFNRNRELVELVHYLLNTHKSLSLLYIFSRVRLHSLKTISQMLGVESAFPVEIQSHLTATTERELRLVYGSVHLEFLLLANNSVGVRDCSPADVLPHSDSPLSLATLWEKLGGQRVSVVPARGGEDVGGSTQLQEDAGVDEGDDNSVTGKEAAPDVIGSARRVTGTVKTEPPVEPCPYAGQAGPKSVPISSALNPTWSRPGSAPPVPAPPAARQSASSPHNVSSSSIAEPSGEHDLSSSANKAELFSPFSPPLLLDCDTLRAGLQPTSSNSTSAPLEGYLFAIAYLSRLDATLEAARQGTPGATTNPIFRELPTTGKNSSIIDWQTTSHSLTMWIQRYPHLGHTLEMGSVKIHLYVCEEEFRLKAKLTFYDAVDPPLQEDIETFETYFSRCVAPLNNEMAMHTFITICRMIPPVFSSLAQLMRAEMEPNPEHQLQMNLQLVTPEGPANQRRVLCGVNVTGTCKKFLLMITCQPSRPLPTGMRNATPRRKTLTFTYELESGRLGIFERPGQSEDPEVANILMRAQSQLSSTTVTQQCSIWPCVRSILESYQLKE